MWKWLVPALIVLVGIVAGLGFFWTTPIASHAVTPMPRTGPAAAGAPDTLYLHRRLRGECAWFYARHEHEAFVTRGSPNGPRFAVADLQLMSSIDGRERVRDCGTASACTHVEKDYHVGCRRSCTSARATHPGCGTAQTEEGCIW